MEEIKYWLKKEEKWFEEQEKFLRTEKWKERKRPLAIFVLITFCLIFTIYLISIKPSHVGMVTYGPGGCVIPEDDVMISESVILCNGTYTFNDSYGNGVIRIINNNTHLTCNGTTIIGNNLENSIGIYSKSLNNVTITNCNIQNYHKGIFFDGEYLKRGNNANISYNTFTNNFYGIYFHYNQNFDIHDNYFFGGIRKQGSTAVYVAGTSQYGRITKNMIYGNGTLEIGIFGTSNFDYLNITYNDINNTDIGIFSQESNDHIIANNYIKNSTINIDFYMTGIFVLDTNNHYGDSKNIEIINNTIIDAGSSGILVQHAENVKIIDNYISILDFQEKISRNYEVDDAGGPPCGIVIAEIWKGMTSEGNEQISDDYSKIHNMSSNNISILGNIFNENINCYLFSMGTTNITHDFANYWYRNVRMDVDFADEQEFFIPNSINTIKRYRPYEGGLDRTDLYFSYLTNSNKSNQRFVYSISKSNMTFKNVKQLESKLSLKNLSIIYPYNDIFDETNGVLLLGNVSEINITLQPNQTIVIGNFSNYSYPQSSESNIIPFTPSPSLISIDSSRTVNSDLNCSSFISDADGDKLNITLRWYKNDVLNVTSYYSNSYSSNSTVSYILGKGNLSLNDVWHCRMRLYDGKNYSYWGISNNVTIIELPGTPSGTIPRSSRGGGGGGGGSSGLAQIKNTANITNITNITIQIVGVKPNSTINTTITGVGIDTDLAINTNSTNVGMIQNNLNNETINKTKVSAEVGRAYSSLLTESESPNYAFIVFFVLFVAVILSFVISFNNSKKQKREWIKEYIQELRLKGMDDKSIATELRRAGVRSRDF
ncbi:MAG: NosD domain-containing protein [Candidatus Woesearchaeota archaeon]